MKPAVVAIAVLLAFSPVATIPAVPDNKQACEQGKAAIEKEGMTRDQCLCMLDEADKHMSPEMKKAFVESLLANEQNPLQRFMELGLSMEELMKMMDAYGDGLENSCGL